MEKTCCDKEIIDGVPCCEDYIFPEGDCGNEPESGPEEGEEVTYG